VSVSFADLTPASRRDFDDKSDFDRVPRGEIRRFPRRRFVRRRPIFDTSDDRFGTDEDVADD